MLPNTLAYQQNYIKSIRWDFRQRNFSLVCNLQCIEKNCMTACTDLIAVLSSMELICFTNVFNQHKPQPHLLYSTLFSTFLALLPSMWQLVSCNLPHSESMKTPWWQYSQRLCIQTYIPSAAFWHKETKKVTGQNVSRAWRMCEHFWLSILQ